MMLFLNDKNSFNLKDIMGKYNISKSTALRDIKSLEEIGMPIYSNAGRHGFYGILQNRLLSPIVFNIDEVFALYFSMLTLKSYESTPFHLSVDKLKQKFENCLSKEKIAMLHKTEKIFSLGAIEHNNHCHFLKDILQFALEEKVCNVTYMKNDSQKSYVVQFFDISSSFGQWYATGFDFETEKPQIFRCDKIIGAHDNFDYTAKAFDELGKDSETLYRGNNATDFEIEISTKGVDLFYKEYYPSMKLYSENGKNFIRGFYNSDETDFIANYFLGYGKNILSVKPTELSNLIVNMLEEIKNHFKELN